MSVQRHSSDDSEGEGVRTEKRSLSGHKESRAPRNDVMVHPFPDREQMFITFTQVTPPQVPMQQCTLYQD
jgi:hypothetical protein